LVLVALGRRVAAFAFAVLEGVLVGILSHLWNSQPHFAKYFYKKKRPRVGSHYECILNPLDGYDCRCVCS
jgi:hypothetical protein